MEDKDLAFLNDCSNEELKALIDILVFDKDGKKRYAESLSNTKMFCENYPNNIKVLVPHIIQEIQLFGGNTLINVIRRHGVSYREILEDVCDKLKVNYNKKLPTNLLEYELLKKVAVTTIEKMSDEDIKKFDANLDKTRLIDFIMENNGAAITGIISIIVAQITKAGAKDAGLMLFGKVLAPRVLSFAVPVLNVLAAVWTVFDLASQAYRVTVPFTITVAFIRRMNDSEDELSSLFA